MDDKSTQFRNLTNTDFETVKSEPNLSNDSTSSSPGKIQEGTSAFNDLYRNFKGDIPFALTFIAIVGYIVIAAFGHILNWSDFFRYITLLIAAVTMYKLLTKELAMDIKSYWSWLLCFLLILFIIIENHNWIIENIKKVF